MKILYFNRERIHFNKNSFKFKKNTALITKKDLFQHPSIPKKSHQIFFNLTPQNFPV